MDDQEKQRLHDIANTQPNFARYLGMRVVSACPDEVVLEMDVTDDLKNRNGVLHGGAALAIADNIGGTLAFLNLKPGEGTTTLESKTNFLRPTEIGDVITATCRPVHRGRTTMVLQTILTRRDGKIAAMISQTQMIMPAKAEARD